MVETIGDGKSHAFPGTDFFTDSFVNNYVGIHRHTQGKNNTGDTIVSFDYTMIKIDGGVFSGVEEESFGGNYIIEPGEEFSILCRVETDAEDFKFLLKSVSWKDSKSGALFRWDNKEYDEQLRQLKLTGNR